MSNVTVGKGKTVHATTDLGGTRCGCEFSGNGRGMLGIRSNTRATSAEVTCKSCIKLTGKVDKPAPVVQDEPMTDNMKDMSDGARFVQGMQGYDVDAVENGDFLAVTVRRSYANGSTITIRATWVAGVFQRAAVVQMRKDGHSRYDLTESDVAQLTYHVDATPLASAA